MLEHKHFIACGYSKNDFRDFEVINNWSVRLIDALGMKVLDGPYTLYSDIEDNVGLTSFTLLTTSHLVIHTFEEANGVSKVEFDVYSCSAIDVNVVVEFLKELDVQNIKYKFLDRDTDLTQSAT